MVMNSTGPVNIRTPYPHFGQSNNPNAVEPDGAVLFADVFEPAPGMPVPHGEIVASTVPASGFNGPVYTNQNHLDRDSDCKLTVAEHMLEGGFPLDRKNARDFLKGYDTNMAVSDLKGHTLDVQDAIRSKAHSSVLSFSQSSAQARTVDNLYSTARAAWDPQVKDPAVKARGDNLVVNLATAFDLNKAMLLSTDPKDKAAATAERAKLQRALVDQVHKDVSQSSEVKDSKKNYEDAVRTFTQRNNSVVVAGGNEGWLQSKFKKDNGGHEVHTPAGFYNNDISTKDTTTVGATRWYNNEGHLREEVGDYSSPNPDINVYASGSVAMNLGRPQKANELGSSFAAPRVAEVMAAEHRQHPTYSHKQVEKLLQQQMTHSLDSPQGEVEVLDSSAASRYLATQTY